MNLLVVDDNKINLMVACAHLNSLGIPNSSIKTAKNGREAAEMCKQESFDLVFMDIEMPEVNGVEATRMILSSNNTPPKIVALTANSAEKEILEYRAAGMEMVLNKPIKKHEIIQALKLAEK